MKGYYRSNDIYQRLSKIESSPFVWVSGNAWILLYGDINANLKAIVLVIGDTVKYEAKKNIKLLKEARVISKNLAKISHAPFLELFFNDEEQEINSVIIAHEDRKSSVSLTHLKQVFANLGIPVSTGSTYKAINDAKSSAYHDWQRNNLGAITVTDIDLIRVDKNREPTTLYELKRSKIPLDKWKPFKADFANFDLLADFAYKTNLSFRIVYNILTESTYGPRQDNASKLKLFSYSRSSGAKSVGDILDFKTFVNSAHL